MHQPDWRNPGNENAIYKTFKMNVLIFLAGAVIAAILVLYVTLNGILLKFQLT